MRRFLLRPLLALACLAIASTAQAGTTLYDRLGGQQGVDRIGADAIALYMSDPRLHEYFDDIAQDWLTKHFTLFICVVADGPCKYPGRDMAASHKGLHIDEKAFNLVVEDLQIVMEHDHVPFFVQNQLLARLAPMERQIVTR